MTIKKLITELINDFNLSKDVVINTDIGLYHIKDIAILHGNAILNSEVVGVEDDS